MDVPIRIDTDIKVRMPELALKFRQCLLARADEFDNLVKNIVDAFDFITNHINEKITDGIDAAFDEMNLQEDMKALIWAELNKRLNIPPSAAAEIY